ncbi:MAG: hypothetical protein IKW30_02520 [Lachnospiraceae bacterium]|nr:hypothetical protein [Lachnospiraceae bacterium]
MSSLLWLGIIIVGCLILVFIQKRKPTEEKKEKQKREYEEILQINQVPEQHYKIVVGQSKVYNIYNCPAIVWKEENVIKTLYLRANAKPILAEQEIEDYMFLASQPYVDFLRFDGTEYPDWAVQPEYVKELFMPYVNSSISKGGIDYKKNMYWIGTTCVYAASMAEMFKMLGRPLIDFTNMVDNKKEMAKDSSIPEDMLEEYRKELAAKKEASEFLKEEDKKDKESMEGMEKAIQVIRDAERKSVEEAINSLYAKLLEDKRFEDLEKATKDEEYRKKLFEEYGM